MATACSVDTYSSDLRSFPDFGNPFFNFYLCQLTRTTVIIIQGALAADAEPLHLKATVLTEGSSVCRHLPLRSVLRVPQVGRSSNINRIG
jgi:hypothetical protein